MTCGYVCLEFSSISFNTGRPSKHIQISTFVLFLFFFLFLFYWSLYSFTNDPLFFLVSLCNLPIPIQLCPLSFTSKRALLYPLIHYCLMIIAFTYTVASDLPPLSFMADKFVICYICIRSPCYLHVYSLVGILLSWRCGWSSSLILSFIWECKSFQPVQSFPSSSFGITRLSLIVGYEYLKLYWLGTGRALRK